ncbi:hypothetical protein PUNSTDRAFT_103860 [Punctularia strigosozonata HHB-11173 SS5]|uniref:uncharacterized protein n=1 Tax=Punctularia strigosozonata (strain HHB-11173) TaxID=741275 RepID=UPI0004417C38|nr:uncharacterized protein PUNSTDRAFT_103860 [Punctularia strigosozonata HHB-11173 SS5]EIN07761.1 hypothetical protein PUNSTDRAFT_103860 [Punctularia strigosozonata HHB-11173 SS5]
MQGQDATQSREQSTNSVYAALARTATRSLALYFSRPVRLFRPSKVNGWQTLRAQALASGVQSITPQYMLSLVRNHGLMVIPKHFVPPVIVNAVLGTVLWTTYAESTTALEHHIAHPLLLSSCSGAIAGAAQALVAAPAENVRLVLEGGTVNHGWSHAWKEVFRRTEPQASSTKQDRIHDAREVRVWMKEVVGEMAGRGWDGWAWGTVKDACGFAVFFSVFEETRRVAAQARRLVQEASRHPEDREVRRTFLTQHAPKLTHGVVLVTGGVFAGVSYEVVTRPFDVARRAAQLAKLRAVTSGTPMKHPGMAAVLRKLEDDGIRSFFQSPDYPKAVHDASDSVSRRLHACLRVLARVGPWGVGFLIFEAFGPGLS